MPATMDALLLLAPTAGSIGYDGRGDFAMAADGRLTRAARARGGALRLCRRGDPLARAVRRRAAGRILADHAVRPRRRGRPAVTACGWKACGCMSARPTPSARRKPRSRPARRVATRAKACMIHGHAGRQTQRLQHPRLGAVSAGADRRLARRQTGAGLSGLATIRSNWPAPRSICRRGAPAAWRARCSSTRLDGDAAILPRIVAIGDLDEDEIVFAQAATGELAETALALPPTLSSRWNAGCCWPNSSSNGRTRPRCAARKARR